MYDLAPINIEHPPPKLIKRPAV
jgi:hypothetical protein